ncbi:tyrosine-type recombinase/integrase [Promethearchaeum syntrophicum]|uniref:Tyrosine-type recombinase/integrase n=1 Tax=Promethearchaeum syntrophicum TaxID=2594042 RepID=A0A5B9D982_9ARCH|nr:tyrosine-type recombinase/integrase [Candidatus Prometheoarchaeum syntrophicum]QEE15633.1 hypothetical protein DSAG12_01459 [Candidatus Prometheoarchaeum syntrophicum]
MKKTTSKKFIKGKRDFSKYSKDRYVQKWVEGVKSKRARYGNLEKYCKFLDKTPEELIKEHHQDLLIDPINQAEIAKKQLFGFFYYLIGKKNNINNKKIEKPLSWNSAKQYAFSKIASFYKRNKVPVIINKKESIQNKKGKNEKIWRNGDDNERISSEQRKDWLKKIYNQFSSIKNKTILLCKISSGLDDTDLFNLKIQDFNRGYFKKINMCYIEGNRQKTQARFQTCFSSEACDSIHTYLKDRERKGENLTERSWLFVVDKRFNDNYSKMSRNLFYDQLLETCNLLDLKNITPKSLRRWYESNGSKDLDAQGSDLFKLTMGHSAVLVGAYQEISHDQESFVNWYKENIESKILILGRNEYIKETNVKMEKITDTITSQATKITMLENINQEIIQKYSKIEETNINLKKQLDELNKHFQFIVKSLNKKKIIDPLKED